MEATEGPAEKISRLNKKFASLEQDRIPVEKLWRQISDYILPHLGKYLRFGDRPKTELTSELIIDPTATYAHRVLSAGMQGGLTSPARPWFRLRTMDLEKMKVDRVKRWMATVQERIYALLSGSNFYQSIHLTYEMLSGFGTAFMTVEEHRENVVYYRPWTIGEYCVGVGNDGLVDLAFRRYWATAESVFDTFGKKNVSDNVRNLVQNGNPYEWLKVCQAIQPRRNRDATKIDNLNMKYESIYWEDGVTDKVLGESGFRLFPGVGPRWSSMGGEVYGRAPTFDCLPDVIMLQAMAEDFATALNKEVAPPLVAPPTYAGTLSLLPNAINPVNKGDADSIKRVYDANFDLASADKKIAQVQMAVRTGLFNDLFLMLLERPGMTATEVVERHEEKLLMLGPVIERQIYELLDPVIKLTYYRAQVRGIMPPPPPELEDDVMEIEYISMLAQAQKMVGTQALQSSFAFVQAVSSVIPNAVDGYNADEAVEQYGDMVGVSPKVIRSKEEREAIRQARAEAEQAAAQAAQAEQLAKTANQAAGAVSQMGSEDGAMGSAALRRLMEGV